MPTNLYGEGDNFNEIQSCITCFGKSLFQQNIINPLLRFGGQVKENLRK